MFSGLKRPAGMAATPTPTAAHTAAAAAAAAVAAQTPVGVSLSSRALESPIPTPAPLPPVMDDSTVSKTLAQIKKDAAAVKAKAREVRLVMRQVDTVRTLYAPLANVGAAAFFVLSGAAAALQQPLYRFSLDFFLRAFDDAILAASGVSGGKSAAEATVTATVAATAVGQADSAVAVKPRVRQLVAAVLSELITRTAEATEYRHHLPVALALSRCARLADDVDWVGLATTVSAKYATGLAFESDASSDATASAKSAETGRAAGEIEAAVKEELQRVTAGTAYSEYEARRSAAMEAVVGFVESMAVNAGQTDIAGRQLVEAVISPGGSCAAGTAAASAAGGAVGGAAGGGSDAVSRPKAAGGRIGMALEHPMEHPAAAARFMQARAEPARPILVACVGSCDPTAMLTAAAPTSAATATGAAATAAGADKIAVAASAATAAAGPRVVAVAMGSDDAVAEAQRAVEGGAREGRWVVLCNAHLALSVPRHAAWLQLLLNSLQSRALSVPLHRDFRLVLTVEAAGAAVRLMPPKLVEACDVLVMEAPAGVKGSMQRSLDSILSLSARGSSQWSEQQGKRNLEEEAERGSGRSGVAVEKRWQGKQQQQMLQVRGGDEQEEGEERQRRRQMLRVRVGMAWVHAVLQERVHYVPRGWLCPYTFMDHDLTWALSLLQAWQADSPTSLTPVNCLPAVQTLLLDIAYGLKMESPADHATLSRIVSHVFGDPKAFFAPRFALSLAPAAPGGGAAAGDAVINVSALLNLLDEDSEEAYTSWVQSLPATCPPEWLGLKAGEDSVRYAKESAQVLKATLRLMGGSSAQ
ncbi:unnamed protein product [Closterium sp. NIES-54]